MGRIERTGEGWMSWAIVLAVSGFLAACVGETIPTFTGDDEEDLEPVSLCSDVPGTICTWAGTGDAGWNGNGNSPLTTEFYWPIDVTVTSFGRIFIVDWNNNVVRRLSDDEETIETAIGTGFAGDGPYDDTDLIPPGAPGPAVNLNHPTHFVHLPDNKMLLTAWNNNKLRLYDQQSRRVRVLAGDGPGFSGDGELAWNALMDHPSQTVVGPDESLYILDQWNHRIRKVDTEGIITTVVGTGVPGFSGDGGPPLQAQIKMRDGDDLTPAGALAFDGQGRLFISDTYNQRIRMVDFSLDRIETVAGTGQAGFGGDGGSALTARLNRPRDIEVGGDGRLYVADELNHRIRAIDLSSGTITTVAGTGIAGFSGDGGQALQAQLNRPAGISFDPDGNLFIADTYNHLIRHVTM
jgi:DNA-binding beta-propeller fold protein YncE